MRKDKLRHNPEKQPEKSHQKRKLQEEHSSPQPAEPSEMEFSTEDAPSEISPMTPEDPGIPADGNVKDAVPEGEENACETGAQGELSALEKRRKRRKFTRKALKRYQRELELRPYQAELIQMQNYLKETQTRMIIVFEGRDAAGKGGTIRRVTRYMNERNYRIVALGKPTAEEESQWFYQKYVAQFPQGGEIVLFDRSWYTRAMVERVFGFCTEHEYKNFMRGVGGFEKDLVRQGTILVKLYFSVTKEEQARRFERRQSDPLRQWKLSKIDVQAQDRWDEFTSVKYDMLKHTGTNIAPWFIIRSNNKHNARLQTMKVILNAVPYERLNPDLDFVPDPDIVFSGARELEIMEGERLKIGKHLHQTIV